MSGSKDTPLLEVRGLSKSFPGVKALQGIGFDLYPGEVHALVGENGAGKSTLLSCINGLLRPDSGEIRIEGAPVHINSPSDAAQKRLAMVHQELVLCPNLSVMENIYLGREPRGRFGARDRAAMRNRAHTLLGELGVPLEPSRKVEALSLNERQIVEIARALASDPRIIVFDEPTASLNDDQARRLLEIIRGLKQRGLGVVYVSHRLEEVLGLAERVTVLRDGRAVATEAARDLDERRLVSLMVGREVDTGAQIYRPRALGPEALAVHELGRAGAYRDVSLTLREGEIVGLAGLLGCQRETLARTLFGMAPADTGEIRLHGATVRLDTPNAAIAAGIAFMSADRKGEGLALKMSVADNNCLAVLDGIGRGGLVQRGMRYQLTKTVIERLGVRVSGQAQIVGQLSGGNQQKIVIGKWMTRRSRIIIAEDPTRGVDVGAKAEIWKALRDLAEEGCAILLLTTELQEMMAMCDRILSMSRGRVTGEFVRADFDMETIAHRFFV